MSNAPLWGRLPAELRERPQWCFTLPSDPDPEKRKAPRTSNCSLASVTTPSHWMTFEQACIWAVHVNGDVGYVLTADDPFGCIDFDVCDAETQAAKGEPYDPTEWTRPEEYRLFWDVALYFNSYTERSRSTKGLHIWVRGKIGKGVRNEAVEIYSQERFIISTGNVVIDTAVEERQEFLANMALSIAAKNGGETLDLIEIAPTMEDGAVLNMAKEAANNEKFGVLFAGEWEQHGFPSQSEADMALMSMFTFYSKSNEQCRRLFRLSGLGKRTKAIKNNRYLDLTLSIIRTRQAKEQLIDVSQLISSAEMRAKLARTQPVSVAALHIPELATGEAHLPPQNVAALLAGPMPAVIAEAPKGGIDWPPGFAGRLAWFIYQSAPRPVKEIAIVGALGLLAGICGKAWFIPGSGLNMYIILVARSAVGKEAMHSGVSSIVKAVATYDNTFASFVDFSDFASGPALIKACANNPSFVNVAGEWGRKLKKLAADDGRDAAMASLRTTMTNLYQKSGPQSIVGGITYSNKDANIASVSGVAYSMIGETTPRTFYDALTESMMEDGFLSRFVIVEYNGERPPMNRITENMPDKSLIDELLHISKQAKRRIAPTAINSGGIEQPIPVNAMSDAAQILFDFEQECDKHINSSIIESWRQMWNRAALKVMRIAALLAVADNCMHPSVAVEHITWALDLVRRDIAMMQGKLDEGDVGTGDHSRERKLLSVIREFLIKGATAGYNVPPKMQTDNVVPHKLLQIKCSQVTSFTTHKAGASEAIKQGVRSLIDGGYISELSRDKAQKDYRFSGKCYLVLNLPDYGSER